MIERAHVEPRDKGGIAVKAFWVSLVQVAGDVEPGLRTITAGCPLESCRSRVRRRRDLAPTAGLRLEDFILVRSRIVSDAQLVRTARQRTIVVGKSDIQECRSLCRELLGGRRSSHKG